MTTSKQSSPRRGEVWLVNLNPTLGAEMHKVRPAVVVSSDAIGVLPVKLIAPFTKWKDWFSGQTWLVPISPDGKNGLTEESAVDALQIRGVAIERFEKKIGFISASELEEIRTAIDIVIESQ